jgi:hypothetical protein
VTASPDAIRPSDPMTAARLPNAEIPSPSMPAGGAQPPRDSRVLGGFTCCPLRCPIELPGIDRATHAELLEAVSRIITEYCDGPIVLARSSTGIVGRFFVRDFGAATPRPDSVGSVSPWRRGPSFASAAVAA